MSLRSQILDSFFYAGIPVVSIDDCCKLLAIVYVLGGSMEVFKYNDKIASEIEYAQKRLNVGEGLTVIGEYASIIRRYVKELEEYYEAAPYDAGNQAPLARQHPKWVVDFMDKRYGLKDLWI
jgi:hypothetical protein